MFGSFTQKKSHFGLIWENRGIRIFHSEKTLKLLTKMTTRSHSIFWSWIQRSQIILNKPYKWRSLIHKCLIGHLWRRELYSYNMSLIIYDVISVAITYLVFLLMCTILNLLHHVVLNIYSINAFSRIFLIETSSMISTFAFQNTGGVTWECNIWSWLYAVHTVHIGLQVAVWPTQDQI